MQKWENTNIIRYRGWQGGLGWHRSTNWDKNIDDFVPGLGDEGWELVTAIPRSSTAGEGGSGFNDEELWVFKRPKG